MQTYRVIIWSVALSIPSRDESTNGHECSHLGDQTTLDSARTSPYNLMVYDDDDCTKPDVWEDTQRPRSWTILNEIAPNNNLI